MRRVRLSASEARRIALAAQGFAKPRPAVPNDIRHFRRAMAAIRVLQLDYVNVLIPAHFLMIWSRLGAYDRVRFETHLYDSGEYTEQWAHEASIVACEDWPMLAHRRQEFQSWKSSPLRKLQNRDEYLQDILDTVVRSGPVTAGDFPLQTGPPGKPGDWHRPLARWALEEHFGCGNLLVRRRQKNFQRVYDLTERVLDDNIRAIQLEKFEAQRAMLRNAARALGVATRHDLADYYRMSPRDAAPRIDELIEEGTLTAVTIEGWSETSFIASTVQIPRNIPGSSLLSPFDPTVWFRPRAQRLFDFEYRIEIYLPAAKRRWGYYVLPFREGDRITARVDLKADRKDSRLIVRGAFVERENHKGRTALALAAELRALASWLELDRITVRKASAFDRTLAAAI